MKRLYGIRHMRWLWNVWCFARWWNNVGVLLGAVPNQADTDYLDGIWDGKH